MGVGTAEKSHTTTTSGRGALTIQKLEKEKKNTEERISHRGKGKMRPTFKKRQPGIKLHKPYQDTGGGKKTR